MTSDLHVQVLDLSDSTTAMVSYIFIFILEDNARDLIQGLITLLSDVLYALIYTIFSS